MNGLRDYADLDTIKYPYQICGIFKTPSRTIPDNLVMTTNSGADAE